MDLNKPCAFYGTIKWPKDYIIPFVYFSNRQNLRLENLFEPMASTITYNSFLDEESMYNNLKERIQNAQYFTDLLSFIPLLFTLDQFKIDLISALEKKYEATSSMESEQNSQIRSIFVAFNIFKGIPSDIMHANIISFLPSKDYKKLPLVSKNFRNIMLNYPFIYNEKGYKISISNMMHTLLQTPLKITFEHKCHSIVLSNEPINVPRSLLLEHSQIPINNIRYWSLNRNPAGSIKELLIKYQSSIHKLEIETYQDTINTITDKANGFKFEQCKMLSLSGSILPVLENKDIFCKLQCLEIFYNTSMGMGGMPPPNMMAMEPPSNPMIGGPPSNPMMGMLMPEMIVMPPWMKPTKEFHSTLNKMLAHLSPTLKCLTLSLPRCSITNESDDTLVIPENIEWLKLKIDSKVDVSKCNKLIGMYLNKPSAFYGTIKWPKDYLIPFVDFSNRHCKDPLAANGCVMEEIFKDPYARFVIIKTSTKRPKKQLYDYGVKISDISSRLNNKIQDTTDKSLVGLELHPSEINDEMESLFMKLMKYHFQDEEVRNAKIELYRTWWQSKSAEWIRDLGKKYKSNLIRHRRRFDSD